ncbi:YbaB/EbfC family nucleoid-associated protein [Nocardia sp. 2]|uniref:YbaB/EbfC family nucleoid-associated protein n=1 Tax=Nocardia acididurans TaxID=2802282 RepID=A0ABS1LXF1_9NOCA|nr:YbaB/EbfC family nucleoid-associated protein [Nocardia acididurans]MBL1072866.1 YbaB/EbfC family nucleoid-associated protein [Nocardia acididurans]
MEQWERDQVQEANAHLRTVVDGLQADFDRGVAELADINRDLAALKVHATTPSDLARVTVNSDGQVVEVTITDDAFARCTPKQLAAELGSAIHGAMEAVATVRQRMLAPLTSIVEGMPDLDEMMPGAPSLRLLRAEFTEGGQQR